MAQQPHFNGMRRADWLSSPFSPIHPSLIDLYGNWAQSFETFISDRSSIGGPRFAMALPNFEDSHWDSASQYSDDVSQQHAQGRAHWEKIDTKVQTIVPMLYNVENVVTSDVIVRFNGGRSEFLSEKRILSAMSGYFKRAFSGRFPVCVLTISTAFASSPSLIRSSRISCQLPTRSTQLTQAMYRLPAPM